MPVLNEHVIMFKTWHGMPIDQAKAKVGDFAKVMEQSAEEYIVRYVAERDIWEKAQTAAKLREHQNALVTELNGKALADVEENRLVEASKSGLNIGISTELSEDGQDIAVLNVTLPGGATRARGPLVSTGTRTPQQFSYFHQGQPLNDRLSRHILANYPLSAAAAALQVYKDKTNKSKLGAWEAVQRDPDLSKVYSRTPKAA